MASVYIVSLFSPKSAVIAYIWKPWQPASTRKNMPCAGGLWRAIKALQLSPRAPEPNESTRMLGSGSHRLWYSHVYEDCKSRRNSFQEGRIQCLKLGLFIFWAQKSNKKIWVHLGGIGIWDAEASGPERRVAQIEQPGCDSWQWHNSLPQEACLEVVGDTRLHSYW